MHTHARASMGDERNDAATGVAASFKLRPVVFEALTRQILFFFAFFISGSFEIDERTDITSLYRYRYNDPPLRLLYVIIYA